MATRYYAKTDETRSRIYVSETPEEHKKVRADGYAMFSPYDVIRFGDHWLPKGFTSDDMRRLIDLCKGGQRYGTFIKDQRGILVYEAARYRKIGRGRWEVVDANA